MDDSAWRQDAILSSGITPYCERPDVLQAIHDGATEAETRRQRYEDGQNAFRHSETDLQWREIATRAHRVVEREMKVSGYDKRVFKFLPHIHNITPTGALLNRGTDEAVKNSMREDTKAEMLLELMEHYLSGGETLKREKLEEFSETIRLRIKNQNAKDALRYAVQDEQESHGEDDETYLLSERATWAEWSRDGHAEASREQIEIDNDEQAQSLLETYLPTASANKWLALAERVSNGEKLSKTDAEWMRRQAAIIADERMQDLNPANHEDNMQRAISNIIAVDEWQKKMKRKARNRRYQEGLKAQKPESVLESGNRAPYIAEADTLSA